MSVEDSLALETIGLTLDLAAIHGSHDLARDDDREDTRKKPRRSSSSETVEVSDPYAPVSVNLAAAAFVITADPCAGSSSHDCGSF